jgi:hypothetical protein
MFLKKIWLKLTNSNEFKTQKFLQVRENAKIEFKEKFEKKIKLIHEKIKTQKKLNFLHSGHAADIVNLLPVIKELSSDHECNLIININKPLKYYYKHPAQGVFINEKIFSMLKPLLDNQDYLNSVQVFSNQPIDIRLDMYRDMPINQLFDNITYASIATGIQPNYSQPFLKVQDHSELTNKIILQRTFRYRNDFIKYDFLNDYKDLFFVGTKDEFLDLKKEIKSLNFYNCKSFLDMASIIKSSKFVIANSSIAFPIAEGLNKPRLLESCPYFPAAQPHGSNAYNFYFQPHFESLFNKLMKLD